MVTGINRNNPIPNTIAVGSAVFNRVDYFSYLGVVLDSEINFEKALSEIIKRMSHKIFTLSIIRKDIPTSCAVQIYKSMILPIVDYSNFCLCTCTDKLRTKVQRLQNRALRICFRAGRYDQINNLHSQAHLPTLDKRRDFDILKLFHRKIYLLNLNFSNITVSGISGNNSSTPACRTRSMDSPMIHTDRPNSEKFRRSLLYSGSQLWNSLPPDLRNRADYNSFKSSVKRRLYPTPPNVTPPNMADVTANDADVS